MSKLWPVIIAVVLLAVIAASVLFMWDMTHKGISPSISGPSTPGALDVALSKSYTNTAHHFSLQMPDGYSVRELTGGDGVETVLIENASADGIQLQITPYDSSVKVLTADDIREQIPDMKIDDVQTIQIGPENQGVAFTSDNAAFNGDSREVWFVFQGTLYQVSTYARLDPLLKAIFASWKFF